MKILAFATTFWDDNPTLAQSKKPLLESWLTRLKRDINPADVFLATGCQDNPNFNPLWEHLVPMVHSGEPKTKPYDVHRWSYFLCAFESALWRAQRLESSWDLLLELETDTWINPKVDVPKLLSEFMGRDDLIMAPSWYGRPDFNFLVLKPAAVPAYLHHRLRGNLVDEDKPQPMLAEDEISEIFRGRWWNPWPEVTLIRQQWGIPENPPAWRVIEDEVARQWPVVALPSPAIQSEFAGK